jgi:hypothetical protein
MAVDPDAAARLREEGPGRWRLVPELGRLLMFERMGEAPKQRVDREVVLAGICRGQTKLASVLNLIHLDRLDGALHVYSGQEHRVLYFRHGVYLAGRSNAPVDRLGRVLVREGLLTAEQRKDAIAGLNSGKRLGTIVVSKGFLTTPQVYDGLRAQAEGIFYATLAAHELSYFLIAPLDMKQVPAMLRLDIGHLLLDGMRQIDEGRANAAIPTELDEEDEAELRRTRPVSIDDLPADGPTRIIKVYNEALRRLFTAVDEGTRANLKAELERFVADSVPYQDLFEGVVVRSDGTLPVDGLVTNLRTISEASITMLQLGLNELLFFVMFAAGDALEADIEERLQRDVARALSDLPQG